MRKRERENPCFVCGHYHKFEDGEVCGICGHRLQEATEKGPQQSAFSTEILPQFLYLGSYDNASRPELLKAQGISRILNTVPTCQNLYKNSFIYHSLKEDKTLPFDECLEFIEQTRRDKARVLVHCMSGQNRSPAVVIAYLMRLKGWQLLQSYQWVKDRRPSIKLTPAVVQQLQEYEIEVFGNNAGTTPLLAALGLPTFGFGFPNPPPLSELPTFTSQAVSTSLTSTPFFNGPERSDSVALNTNFVFGAVRQEQPVARAAMDHSMDSS
ncbi:hypothetical protein BDL97_19G093700 [Sphagnum fallax]|jgi:dual specificity MAP kinase phosphatase|nr:hypothetical protein BDL97_19G093700 [Sphagnum fallax]